MIKRVGLLLTRNPSILPKLEPFTEAYMRYREGQTRDEARPFHHSFYYKKGTLPESKWLEAQKIEENAQPCEDALLKLEMGGKVETDLTSLNRQLDKKLYLAFKENGKWVLPSKELKDDLLADVIHLI